MKMSDIMIELQERVELGEITHEEVMLMNLDEILDLISSKN